MKPEEMIELLKGMQSSLEDYAELVGAPAFTYGHKYVYPYPEDYAIEEAIKALKEVKQYREIGTVEECREAVERQTQKKCAIDSCPDHTHYKCPSCGKIQMSEYKRGIRILGRITNFCDNCGQRLESEK